MLLFQTPDSLPNTALALQSLELMLSSAPPAVLTLAPKWTKLYTSSSSSPVTNMFSSLAALNLMTFVLVMLIFRPVPLLALFKRSFFNCSRLLVLDSSARSSAKSRSSNFYVNPYLIPVFPSLSVFLITQSMTSKKTNPELTHPCRTPDLMSNQPVLPPPSITAHLLPLYIA